MYIRKTTRVYNGKTYTNHLLVESVQTPQGPRQRTICSLGSLEPASAEHWRALAHKLDSALQGQQSLPPVDSEIQPLRAKAIPQAQKMARASTSVIVVEPDSIQLEEGREAGPVHVGHQIWNQLGMNAILQRAGLSRRACLLSEVMTLNRLIFPLSEHAMPDWIRRTALGDILQQNFSALEDETLYRNLDRLHPNREAIERELAEGEKTLFNLDDSVFLYDLTSTYFEGQAHAGGTGKENGEEAGSHRDRRPWPGLRRKSGRDPQSWFALPGGRTAKREEPGAGSVRGGHGMGRGGADSVTAKSWAAEDTGRDQASAKRGRPLHSLSQ